MKGLCTSGEVTRSGSLFETDATETIGFGGFEASIFVCCLSLVFGYG